MVIADGVAIAAGAVLHKRLPEGILHRMAAVMFLLFGLWMLFDSALGWRWPAVAITGSVAVAAVTAGVIGLRRARRWNRRLTEADATLAIRADTPTGTSSVRDP